MEPKWPTDGNTYISHYEYRPGGGQTIRYDPKDVVHFRWGLDLRNPRKGMAPLYSVLREIFTDDEAANFTASLMRNLGVPGVIIAPDVPNAKVSKEDADEVKRDFKANFGGDNRGEPMVMKAPTKVQVLSFSPEQMLLRDLRRIPEERVSAVFGVPAIVAGLGAGLDRATYDNAEKLVEFAVEQNIIPTQRIIASELRTQLLADFDTKPNHLVDFDLSRVRALQPDQDKLYERIDRAVLHGWATVAEAKRIVGLPVLSGDDVYLRMLAYQSVPATKAARELATKAAGGGFPDALALARRRLAERSEAEIIKFFESQARRVRARLARVVNLRSANGSKQIVSPDFLIPAEEDGLLIEAMQPLWLAGIDLGWTMADDAFSLGAAFDPADAIVAALLAEASFRAVRINGGTRANIGEALAEAERVGYTVQQIVRGVEADGFMGLADRVESYYANRPLAIARTESMWSTGMGTSGAYQRAGVQRVMMIDPGDDPACAARNGRIVTVAQGQSALGDEHVHGNLALVPV